jgi:hypothetical protein
VHNVEASGSLLPGIGCHDPEGRQGGTQGDHERGKPVRPSRYALCAEQQDAEERGLQKKRDERLGSQRRAKDVPHKAGIAGPVGAKFELHDHARGHAAGEDHAEDVRPEAQHTIENLVGSAQAQAGHDDQHHTEAHGENRIQVVHHHGQGELRARQGENAHRLTPALR